MYERISHRRRKEIGSLLYKKYRERRAEMLVEGYRSVLSALDADAPMVDIIVTDHARDVESIHKLLADVTVPVYVASADEFNRFSDVETSQGILAIVRITPFPETRLYTQRSILALDGIQDPGNVGTLIRTAAWFGVDAILAGQGTVDLYNPKVIRASMGGMWEMALAETADLVGSLSTLKERGYSCYGADLNGISSRQWVPLFPCVLVLGSEATGLSVGVSTLLDERISVLGRSRKRGIESLNVAVAASVMMYEWMNIGDG